MRMFNNVKQPKVIYLKFGEKFLACLTMLGLKSIGSTSSTTKEKLLLYCRKFSAFVVAVII